LAQRSGAPVWMERCEGWRLSNCQLAEGGRSTEISPEIYF
jgi:hypothetical protein